jgi:NAD(P) transhydrogenase subunit alpha
MIHDLILLLTVFMLSFTVGWEILARVPPTLHAPLLGGLSAIAGVVVVGAALLLQFGGAAGRGSLGFFATFLASFQIASALVVGHRLLRASRKKN